MVLREAPRGPVVAWVPNGTTVVVLAEAGDSVHVQTEDTPSVTGWAKLQNIKDLTYTRANWPVQKTSNQAAAVPPRGTVARAMEAMGNAKPASSRAPPSGSGERLARIDPSEALDDP